MPGVVAGVGFFVILVVVILLHEAGHLLAAKRFDIKVEEYFVGFGPRLWSRRRGETEYGVKALVLGGYVKIAGMNPLEEPKEEDLPRTFGAKPIWQRALVIVAGPATHFILAFVVLVLWLMLAGQPTKFAAAIGEVEPKLNGTVSPAAAAGLKAGDVVLAVDGQPVDSDTFVQYTRAHLGQSMSIVVLRDGQELTFDVTPVESVVNGKNQPRIGVLMSPGRVLERDRSGFFGSFADAGNYLWSLTGEVVHRIGEVFGPEGIARIFRLVFGDAQRSVEDPLSVVGAGRVAGQAASAGAFDGLVALFVSLNVFIGLLNLVPLLPLDGGHLAVLAVEKLRRGRPVDMRKLIPVSAVVVGFLVAFMLAVVYLDFAKPVPNVFQP